MNQKCHEAKFGTRKPFCMHIFYLYHKLPKTGLLFNTNLRIAFKALFSFDSFFLLWTCVYFIHILRPPWALSCIVLFICRNTKQCSLFLKSVDTAFVNFPFSAKGSRVFVSKTCFFLSYVNRELKRNLYCISDSAGHAGIRIEILCWHTGPKKKKICLFSVQLKAATWCEFSITRAASKINSPTISQSLKALKKNGCIRVNISSWINSCFYIEFCSQA